MPPKKVLFLCTGNYYRSRFAEELFNHLAEQKGLAITADSAGLKVAESRTVNLGTFSKHSYTALQRRRIIPRNDLREPRQLDPREISPDTLAIALSESEHQPIFQQLHPELLDRIRFWRVEDLNLESAQNAIEQIERNVRQLIDEL
ncbi:hypothetical protein [Pelagicoccus sp. SDUM812003]|uniref:arsenate-mycothiol transferase ArsC n=1 Tax=Pelagicoccus sp. SDUM812003 TaxID=3041267 RepID=UPI00281048B6|nr:hypothetical protein [Pelagicoccus sp. SDUM812003]MDQ8204100.1 hypothetical protein [Pelagicoccus sp. SDUM812003]